MKSLQKLGGIGALVAAATFVIGLVMFGTMLIDYTTATEPAQAVEFLVNNQVPLYVWNIIITIIFGIAIVPLALAMRDHLDGPLSRIATVFGLIWSGVIIATGMITNIGIGTVAHLNETSPQTAATVWSALDAVQNGLGGGNEVVGGVWVLLLSIAALGAGVFPRWLNYLGVVMGIAGIVTVIPPLENVGAVFGIGLIVWFVTVGVNLYRGHTAVAPVETTVPVRA
jgi:hypothetical protein